MKNKKNNEIKSPKIRVIFQKENKGIMPFKDALQLAKSMDLDLIEVSSSGDVSICKIDDWGKFQYETSKKNKKSHKKDHEVRFRVSIDPHDLQTKVNNIIKFISKGDKVKIVITFRGREISHENLGTNLIGNILNSISKKNAITYTKPSKSGKNIHFFVENANKN